MSICVRAACPLSTLPPGSSAHPRAAMVVYIALSENPHGIVIVTVLWSLTVLAGTFLGLRLYAKLVRRRRLWWDDYFIVVAWVCISCCIVLSSTWTNLPSSLRNSPEFFFFSCFTCLV